MNWPAVTVLIVTYNRPAEVRETIRALRENLTYPGEVRWHVADDSSPTTYVPDILGCFPDLGFTYTITPKRSGWGINVNTGLRTIETPYIFQCEDDQVAQRPLDLAQGVLVMECVPEVGLVRYDGIEGHRLVLHMDETPKIYEHRVHFLRVDKRLSLDQKEVYGYSHRPHLKHRRFHEVLGGYPEGLNLGSTEMVYAHHVMNHEGSPEIVALADGVTRAFRHDSGRSRQFTEEDVGTEIAYREQVVRPSGCSGCGKR